MRYAGLFGPEGLPKRGETLCSHTRVNPTT